VPRLVRVPPVRRSHHPPGMFDTAPEFIRGARGATRTPLVEAVCLTQVLSRSCRRGVRAAQNAPQPPPCAHAVGQPRRRAAAKRAAAAGLLRRDAVRWRHDRVHRLRPCLRSLLCHPRWASGAGGGCAGAGARPGQPAGGLRRGRQRRRARRGALRQRRRARQGAAGARRARAQALARRQGCAPALGNAASLPCARCILRSQ